MIASYEVTNEVKLIRRIHKVAVHPKLQAIELIGTLKKVPSTAKVTEVEDKEDGWILICFLEEIEDKDKK